jgi:hypothetical protein
MQGFEFGSGEGTPRVGMMLLLAALTTTLMAASVRGDEAGGADDRIDPEALAPAESEVEESFAVEETAESAAETPEGGEVAAAGAALVRGLHDLARSPLSPSLPPQVGHPRMRRISRTFGGPQPGQAAVMADLPGPGVIRHIWWTTPPYHRGQVLRIYWDDEPTPSVEVPLVDFFGGGLEMRTPVMTVVPNMAYNSYFPMPFRKRARLELYNPTDGSVASSVQFIQIDWEKYPAGGIPEDTPYFHAQWNRINPATDMDKQVPVCRAAGEGAFLGMTMQVHPREGASDRWFHGGGDLQVVDAAGNDPMLLAGIGGEDYFGGSWGSPEFETPLTGIRNREQPDGQTKVFAYRFHLAGPIQFRESLLSRMGSVLGDYTLVSYWYQREPHRDFLKPIDGAAVAENADLPLGSRLLEPRPQERIEWLYGDGTVKAISDYFVLNLNRYVWKGFRHWHDADLHLRTTFTCPQARKAQIRLAFDDHIEVDLNGEQVLKTSHRPAFEKAVVDVDLKAGENEIAIHHGNRGGTNNWWAWTLTFRITDEQGRTMQDLDFAEYPEVPEGKAK